ncbi:MAG: 6-phosphofructokinase [Zoogloeaceae bacterium]|jgi:6-phosphofructokinase 1|nr:6-phosphofructokinase [Zoogloeaceae bacterium]
MPKNAFYAQSGGVTAVINASACGVIETARRYPEKIGKVYAGRDGILGALSEDLIDTSLESDAVIARLRHTPGGAFGSCRYKLKSLDEQRAQYERLIEVFRAHDIGYFFYNGGNDSMDTAWKVAQLASRLDFPLISIGIPKTVDNDLAMTDCSPGFGSVAKYVATSMRETGLDVASMARTSTKIFVLEVMGRHAGWITAACGLAAEQSGEPPHILLFPEIPFAPEAFLERVAECVKAHGFCTVAVSEGLSDASGRLIAEMGGKDAFGHAQLGGVGQIVAQLIKDKLGHKYHWALADYLQRSARHIASATDVEHAYAVGRAAVEAAVAGKNAVMPAITRTGDAPYRWEITYAGLENVANHEKKLPREFITPDGFHITDLCRRYLAPLIEGEDFPPFARGLPDYARLQNRSVAKKLKEFVP